MDAWANVSHYLAYKGEASIPAELRRDFHALSGLFYVADRQFQTLFDAALRSKDSAVEELESGEPDGPIPLNRDTLLAYLAQHMPNRRRADAADVSELVDELSSIGYNTIEQFAPQVEKSRKLADEVAESYPPAVGTYSDAAMLRLSLAISDENYMNYKYPNTKDLFVDVRKKLSTSNTDTG